MGGVNVKLVESNQNTIIDLYWMLSIIPWLQVMAIPSPLLDASPCAFQ